VLPGMLLIIASFVALTQVTATTSYWWLGVVLFVMGLGMGGSMWWATGFVVIATLVSLLLPRTKPEPIDDPDDPDRAR
jgi:membrane protein implicated in regulation of membrane protease activity